MSHYYKDVINSLSRSLDTMLDDQARRSEAQKIYGEDELQTVDPDEAGPWHWSETGIVPPSAIPRG